MKIRSFLFFILLSFLFFPNIIKGQVEMDSTRSYYNAIWGKKGIEVSIDSAINHFEDLANTFIKSNDSINTVNCLRSIAHGYFTKGAIFESELAVTRALQLMERMPNNSFKNSTRKALYIHLGMLYRKINDYNNAIRYYKQSLELSETSHDSIRILNNIANVYTDDEKYQLAVNNLNLANSMLKSTVDYKNRWTVVDNLGYNESKLNISGGLDKMQLALQKKLKENDMEGVFSSYRHLSFYYFDRNDENRAQFYASEAYKMADSLNNPSFELEALRLNALLAKDSITRKFVMLSDSINKAKQTNDNRYSSKKYEYAKQEKIAKENELKYEKQKSNTITVLSILIFIVLLSMFLYFVLKSRHKKEKLKQIYNTENRISKKVHDEVANDVYHVMAKLQSNSNLSEEVLDDLEGIYSKTRDISKELNAVNVSENFDELLKDLLLSYKSKDVNLITRNISKIDWRLIQDIKKTTIYRVLQELMTNMKKHSKASIVVLTFNQAGKKLKIDYSDNGVGCEIKTLGGLQNAENRMQSINGRITFESKINNGFKAKITV